MPMQGRMEISSGMKNMSRHQGLRPHINMLTGHQIRLDQVAQPPAREAVPVAGLPNQHL